MTKPMFYDTVRMMVTKCYATTAVSRENYKILDVIQLLHDSHPLYGPNDLFLLLDAALNVDQSVAGYQNSLQYLLVQRLWSGLAYEITREAVGLEHRGTSTLLRQFIALPVICTNNQWFSQGSTPADRGRSATLASSSYRVID